LKAQLICVQKKKKEKKRRKDRSEGVLPSTKVRSEARRKVRSEVFYQREKLDPR
jgi:hypothetical protein